MSLYLYEVFSFLQKNKKIQKKKKNEKNIQKKKKMKKYFHQKLHTIVICIKEFGFRIPVPVPPFFSFVYKKSRNLLIYSLVG